MDINTGIIKVIQLDSVGVRSARIQCPPTMIPDPGQYLLAYNPDEPGTPLGHALFASGLSTSLEDSINPLLGPIPGNWDPGTRLRLRGPLGRGFQGAGDARRLGVCSFSSEISRLLPLMIPALESGADIALFLPSHLHPGALPAAVEVHPLQALPESLSWATHLVMEIKRMDLPNLRGWLHLAPHQRLSCRAEALILTPMPCGAMGDCCACAVPTPRRRYQLTCKDGPVFDLNQLDW